MPHDHHHIDPEAGDRRVFAAIAVNIGLTFVQIAGGIASGSMALIADALHNFSDAISLIVAFAARRIARKPADAGMTFGYGRAEVVAALVNYTTLIVIALYLCVEGFQRLFDPPGVDGWIVVWVSAIALTVDAVTAALTYRMSKTSMNIRAAFLHNLSDALSSVAVIVAGTAILLYDWRLIDPLVTLGIAGYILWQAGREVVPVIHLLMLGSPSEVRRDRVSAVIGSVPNVMDLHHLHVWQISEHRRSVEAHVVVRDLARFPETAEQIKTRLSTEFGITHSTLQPETEMSGCPDTKSRQPDTGDK